MSDDRESLQAMAHALRSPLNGIIGCAELLYDEEFGPLSPQQREYLSYLLAAAQELRQAVDELLERMRPATAEHRLPPTEAG